MKVLNKISKDLDILDLSDFEKESLIPTIISRMKFYRECFEKLIPVCNSEENAFLVDAAVRKCVSSPSIDSSETYPSAGKQYLESIKAQIQSYWIAELDKFLADYPDASAVADRKKLFFFIQRTQQLAGAIVWCKSRLLSYSLRGFPLLMNKHTGEVISGPPLEVEIILYPFLGAISEMESSAHSIISSVKDWSRARREERKDFINYLSAIQQSRAARYLCLFQALLIIFTVVFTLFASRLEESVAKFVQSFQQEAVNDSNDL